MSSKTRLDDLNAQVSRAIRLAEEAEDDSAPNTAALYAEVADPECELATLHPADTVEGAVARRGAVRAYRKAGQDERAALVADDFLSDPRLGNDRREQIWAILAEPDASKP